MMGYIVLIFHVGREDHSSGDGLPCLAEVCVLGSPLSTCVVGVWAVGELHCWGREGGELEEWFGWVSQARGCIESPAEHL